MHYILKDFLECNQGQLAWNGAQITSKYPTNRYWSDGSCLAFFFFVLLLLRVLYMKIVLMLYNVLNTIEHETVFRLKLILNELLFEVKLTQKTTNTIAHEEITTISLWLYDDNDCSCNDDDDDDWKNLQFALKYVQCFIQCIDSSSRHRSSSSSLASSSSHFVSIRRDRIIEICSCTAGYIYQFLHTTLTQTQINCSALCAVMLLLMLHHCKYSFSCHFCIHFSLPSPCSLYCLLARKCFSCP